jgi:hypothetical protein
MQKRFLQHSCGGQPEELVNAFLYEVIPDVQPDLHYALYLNLQLVLMLVVKVGLQAFSCKLSHAELGNLSGLALNGQPLSSMTSNDQCKSE